jgi:hypothetical protein
VRRILVVMVVLALVGGACNLKRRQPARQTGTDGEVVNPFAGWPTLEDLVQLLGLADEDLETLGAFIFSDGAGDQFHPNPQAQVSAMAETDIARGVAFTARFTQEQLGDFESAFTCSDPEALGTFAAGDRLVWCPPERMPFPPGDFSIFCGETNGIFPVEVPDPQTQYEYGVVFQDPDPNQNFSGVFENDLFNGGSIAVGARYSHEGPEVFMQRHQPGNQQQPFGPINIPYRVMLGRSENKTTFCGLVSSSALGQATQDGATPYPFRMFSFCGTFQQGAADFVPDSATEFNTDEKVYRPSFDTQF